MGEERKEGGPTTQPWTDERTPSVPCRCSPTPSFVPAACVAKGLRRWCGPGVTAEVGTWEDEEGRKKGTDSGTGGKREREGEDEAVFDFVTEHQETTQLTQYMYMQEKKCLTRGLLSWRRNKTASRPRRRPPVLTGPRTADRVVHLV